jgi:HPt (histidine-containing phosphotransfer) domain-containing protein
MDSPSIFNYELALDRLDGDQELFADLVKLFLGESPKEFAAIAAAMSRQDAAVLASAAHKLKGSVTQFCADRLLDNVKNLEKLGRAGDLAAASSVCAAVEVQLCELQNALRTVIDARMREAPLNPNVQS